MTVAYVDTSCVLAVALDEPGSAALARRLSSIDTLISVNLLEAELRAALARERVEFDAAALAGISWIVPGRPLSDEIAHVIAAGPLRGADTWHLAAALYVAEEHGELAFLTLDARQRSVARALGFRAHE